MSNELKIEELWIYPVKGCGGIRVTDSWPITTRGFLHDRNWMLVDASTGKFISQRVLPPMCLIKTELLLDQGLLAINAPGMASTLIIPTTPPVTPLPLRQVICWAWAGKAFDCGDDAAAWFSQYLDRPVRLVRFAGENTSPGDEKHRAVDRHHFGQPNDEIAFSDQHPFLIAHSPSLKALNEMIKTQQQHSSSLGGGGEAIEEEELKMNRFRPNIILSGGSAWEEDEWRLLHFQKTGLEILVAKPCSRCKVPSINQETGVQGEEPNITLENHRLGSRLGWGGEPSFKHAIFFGVQGGPVFKGDVKKGSIDVTDGVVVVETTRWYKEK
jgi:uncharacterized protein